MCSSPKSAPSALWSPSIYPHRLLISAYLVVEVVVGWELADEVVMVWNLLNELSLGAARRHGMSQMWSCTARWGKLNRKHKNVSQPVCKVWSQTTDRSQYPPMTPPPPQSPSCHSLGQPGHVIHAHTSPVCCRRVKFAHAIDRHRIPWEHSTEEEQRTPVFGWLKG